MSNWIINESTAAIKPAHADENYTVSIIDEHEHEGGMVYTVDFEGERFIVADFGDGPYCNHDWTSAPSNFDEYLEDPAAVDMPCIPDDEYIEAIQATTYAVYVADAYACQIGEKYDWGRVDGEEEEAYSGKSLEDAMSALEAVKRERDGYHNVIKTKRGLDTVEYAIANVYKYVDGEYEDTIETWESLSEEMRQKMKESERSMWAYLDYEADSYHGVE